MNAFPKNKISGERDALPRVMWADCDPDSKLDPVVIYPTRNEQRGNRPDLKPVPVLVVSLDQPRDKIMTDVTNALLAIKGKGKSMVKCITVGLALFSCIGCETYKRQAWTPDGFNYTVSRDRKTGDQTDYFGATWNLKP